MKIRAGFVSNSSSASFVASLSVLTREQIQAIVDYCDDPDQNEDGWSAYVNVSMGLLEGYTSMNNGAFSDWLEKQGINKVRFGE